MTSAARVVPLQLLAALALIAALKVAQPVLAPIMLALVVGVVIAPLSSRLTAAGLPSPAAATIGVVLATASVVLLVAFMEPYISRAIARAPVLWGEVRETVETIRAMVVEFDRMAETVNDALAEEGGGGAPEEGEGENVDPVPSASTAIIWAPSVAVQLLTFVGCLFFFLLGRDEAYVQLSRGPLDLSVARLQIAEQLVSRYFLTITIINAALGCAVAVAMTAIGLEAPILWGVLAFLLNFILYLGPITLAVGLLVAGLVTFNGAASLLPPAIYLALNMVEAQFVTPSLVGRSLNINPLVVFLSLVLWLWLWGPVGGIIAIPVLVWCLAITGAIELDVPEELDTLPPEPPR